MCVTLGLPVVVRDQVPKLVRYGEEHARLEGARADHHDRVAFDDGRDALYVRIAREQKQHAHGGEDLSQIRERLKVADSAALLAKKVDER